MPERGPEGTFRTAVTPADVLDVFETVEGPVLGAGDVAAQLGCTRSTARRKLGQLAERGLVDSRMVGRTKVYWPTEPVQDLDEWLED
jgi:DNA-binding IclR family transcriptional regulator